MQNYIEIPANEPFITSRAEILNNDKTILSNSSGTAFPTENLQIGMFCFRTDQSKIYALYNATPTWIVIADISQGLSNEANMIHFVPSGDLSSTNVSDALKELDQNDTTILNSAKTYTDNKNYDASHITTGVLDISRIPQSAIEKLTQVVDQTARFALTTDSVQLGDTVKQLDTGMIYIVVDIANLANENGYVEYAAGTAASAPWSGITGKPTLIGDSGITDVYTKTQVDTEVSNAISTASTDATNKANIAETNAKTYTDTIVSTAVSNINTSGNASTATKLATAITINGVSFDGTDNITINAVDSTARIASAEKGAANGVATLNESGLVKTEQLPSYVDDVLEYANLSVFPVTGETGKIYVALDTNKIYRWTGSTYIEISPTAGSSDSATKLATARTLSYTGDVVGSMSFDGSQDVSTTLALANTGIAAGTYQAVTVDAKGRVTAGSNPTTLSGYGITDAVSGNNPVFTGTATATLFYAHGGGGVVSNTAYGDSALSSNTSGGNNVAVGSYALNLNTTGNYNIANGTYALNLNTTGNYNTANGAYALKSNTTGNNNTANGFYSLKPNTTGHENTANGAYALYSNITGSYNTATGYSALRLNTTGQNNTATGYNALYSNVSFSNCSGFGSNSSVTADNQVQLGDSSTSTFTYGTVQNRSDARDKTDISTTALGLDFINKLHPVDFRWDYREDYKSTEEYEETYTELEEQPNPNFDNTIAESEENKRTIQVEVEKTRTKTRVVEIPKDGSKKRNRKHHGLIAQEVKAVIDATGIDFGGYQDHSVSGGEDVLSIGYGELIAPLIKAVQELNTVSQEQQKIIDDLKMQVNVLLNK